MFTKQISKIRHFINQERPYMIMLAFIFLINAFLIAGDKLPVIADQVWSQKLAAESNIDKEEEFEDQVFIDEDVLLERVEEDGERIIFLANLLSFTVLAVFGLGLFLDLRILIAFLKKRRIFQAGVKHISGKWGIWDIFRLMIIFVFLGYLLNIFEAHFLFNAAADHPLANLFPMLNTGFLDLVILGFIIYFVKVRYKQSLATIGLKTKGLARNILLAMLSYIAFLPVLFVILVLVVILSALFNYHPPQQEVLKVFLQQRSIWVLCYTTIMVVFLGPVVEEVFFRGFAYNAIKRKIGKTSAMLLTAAIFAGLHANLIGFLPIMALGFLLVYMYEKTGSLVSSITIHILHNGVMVLLLFFGRYLVTLTQ
ncbi:lysostaphin resistance A-like protein [Candidatus Omnitrophota bacterium]